jgi:hypothetical protein
MQPKPAIETHRFPARDRQPRPRPMVVLVIEGRDQRQTIRRTS